MRQSFVRVDGNRLRIQNGHKDFDAVLDTVVTCRPIEVRNVAVLELQNVPKPANAFNRIIANRMNIRLHCASAHERDCWLRVCRLAATAPRPCQHWYSGKWSEESVVFKRKEVNGQSGTWLELLARRYWSGLGGAASEKSLRSLVLKPMRVDTSHPGSAHLQREAGMQVVCCQVLVADVVYASGRLVSSEGRVTLLLRETASSPMPQWNLLRVAIHECGGRDADANATQIFATRQHSMMLVYDAAALAHDACIEQVCWWVKRFRKHTHRPRVFLVGTRAHELSQAEQKATQHKLMSVLRSTFEGRTAKAPLVGERIFFVSLTSLQGVNRLRQAVCGLLAQVPQLGFEPTIPCRFARLADLARSLREKRQVISLNELTRMAVRRLGFAAPTEAVGKKGSQRREWADTPAFDLALELLHQRGKVLWLEQPASMREWVFLNPHFVAKLVRHVWHPDASFRSLNERGVLKLDYLTTLWRSEPEVNVVGHAALAGLLAAFGVLDYRLHRPLAVGKREAEERDIRSPRAAMAMVAEESETSSSSSSSGGSSSSSSSDTESDSDSDNDSADTASSDSDSDNLVPPPLPPVPQKPKAPNAPNPAKATRAARKPQHSNASPFAQRLAQCLQSAAALPRQTEAKAAVANEIPLPKMPLPSAAASDSETTGAPEDADKAQKGSDEPEDTDKTEPNAEGADHNSDVSHENAALPGAESREGLARSVNRTVRGHACMHARRYSCRQSVDSIGVRECCCVTRRARSRAGPRPQGSGAWAATIMASLGSATGE